VRDRISERTENFLDLDQYQVTFEEAGVRDQRSQNTLAGLLHDQGIALHFENDSRLRNTVVLKPEWLAEAAYGILNSSLVQAREGIC
jgi:internalin A